MRKQRVELHVMAEQELAAKRCISWDATIRELFDYQGGGVWYSSGTYERGFDDLAVIDLRKFTEERMREYKITEFYVDIVDFDD